MLVAAGCCCLLLFSAICCCFILISAVCCCLLLAAAPNAPKMLYGWVSETPSCSQNDHKMVPKGSQRAPESANMPPWGALKWPLGRSWGPFGQQAEQGSSFSLPFCSIWGTKRDPKSSKNWRKNPTTSDGVLMICFLHFFGQKSTEKTSQISWKKCDKSNTANSWKSCFYYGKTMVFKVRASQKTQKNTAEFMLKIAHDF